MADKDPQWLKDGRADKERFDKEVGNAKGVSKKAADAAKKIAEEKVARKKAADAAKKAADKKGRGN